MSSLRPLATITLLALVGVFLYMKINETEPQLPADIANWTMTEQLEITQSPAIRSFGDTSPSSPSIPATSSEAPPAFAPAQPPKSSAPAFSATPPTSTTPPESSAPGFSASPPAFQPQVADSEESTTKAADMPALPVIPVAKSTAASATAEAAPPLNVSTPAVEKAPTADPISAPELDHSEQPIAEAQPTQSSLFSATLLAVQAALDRGELSQALLLLSDWYGDPSLTPEESDEVNMLLSQLAGSVIYSTEPRLEPPYMVQAGEDLQGIAQKYDVPWQLLAKINGVSDPDSLQPGQQLKVVRGPFSALVDLSQRRMTLMLDRRYAGQFAIDIDPSISVEEGHWTVNQKLITPGNVGLASSAPTPASDQKSIMMTSASGGASQIAILRSGDDSGPASEGPAGRVIRLKTQDMGDIYDILSLGSLVVIRR